MVAESLINAFLENIGFTVSLAIFTIFSLYKLITFVHTKRYQYDKTTKEVKRMQVKIEELEKEISKLDSLVVEVRRARKGIHDLKGNMTAILSIDDKMDGLNSKMKSILEKLK